MAATCSTRHNCIPTFLIQHNHSLFNTIQYDTTQIQYNTIQYNTIQCNTIQYNTTQIQCNTIQHKYNTIQYNTTQHKYNTIQYFIVELHYSMHPMHYRIQSHSQWSFHKQCHFPLYSSTVQKDYNSIH